MRGRDRRASGDQAKSDVRAIRRLLRCAKSRDGDGPGHDDDSRRRDTGRDGRMICGVRVGRGDANEGADRSECRGVRRRTPVTWQIELRIDGHGRGVD